MNPLIVYYVTTLCALVTWAFRPYDIDCCEYMPVLFQEDVERHASCPSNVYKDESWTVYGNELSDNTHSHKDGESKDSSIVSDTLRTAENCSCKSTYCHCSKRKLKHVPQDLPYNTTNLDLSNNVISYLSNCTFCNYTHLTYLDLSTNNLTQLEIGSFWGLVNLTYLSLHNNYLKYLDKTFPLGVFGDLQSLRTLKLNRNSPFIYKSKWIYPDRALSELANLKTLYLDGLQNLVFGKNFRKLEKLESLTLAGGEEGFCSITNIPQWSFHDVSQISTLNISNCFINGKRLGTNVFTPLVNLVNLDISFNFEFSLTNVLDALRAVRGYNITTLRMNVIQSKYLPPVIISRSMIQSLPMSLRYLEAQGNNFQSIDQGALQEMPPNLSYVNMGGNIFRFGAYLNDLPSLRSLKILKLNGGDYLPKIPKYVTTYSDSQQCNEDSKRISNSEPLIIKLPPNLLCLSLRFSGLKYRLTELTFNESNNLESLILTNNDFPSLQGPIKGLPKLQKFYVSNCHVAEVEEEMFRYLDALQELRLRNNQLDNFIHRSRKPIFQYLKNLKFLDLTNNALTTFQESFLENLDSLEQIDLSRNNMRHFNLSLDKMSHLRILNLSKSQLSSLPVATRKNIDSILTNHSVMVDMSHSPILCDCKNFDFIKWMVNSKAFNSSFTGYMCQYEDTSTKMINDSYEETLHNLTVKCADNTTLFLVVISVTLSMMAFVAVAVVYRFRWKLKYLYYVAYLMLKDKKNIKDETENFRYDVFISYAYEDEEFILESILPEFNQRELKVLVHGRDFAVGEFIASNIVTAVKESRKTLVVLTRHLLNSTWCNFEIQMANMESVHTGRPVLVFLIKESIATTEMTSDLLYHLKRNTYIDYPQGKITRVFWDKLTRDIQIV